MTNSFTSSGLFGGLYCDASVATQFGVVAFTRRMMAFEIAWTRALAASGVVAESDAAIALEAMEQFSHLELNERIDRDGIPVPALVSELKKGLPEGAAEAIHSGATSQDVIDTAMVLTCLEIVDMFASRISDVLVEIDNLIERHGDRPLMARTRMQAALPATVALRLRAWRRPLADHLKRAKTLREELAVAQIGGPIGSRNSPASHVEACAEEVARSLGLTLGPVWHTDRSRMVEFGHWLALVTGSLGKIGQDIALMAQQGVDEIAVSSGGGSSAMPHKQNPVLAEAMITLVRYVVGQQGILGQAMIHEQERSGAAWALEWLTLPAMAEATGASLNNAKALLASVERIGMPE